MSFHLGRYGCFKKIGEFANSIDPEEVAHKVDLHCLHPSSSSHFDTYLSLDQIFL